MMYLLIAIPEGVDGVRAKLVEQVATFDGGITPNARSEFREWVDDIRFELGAREKENFAVAALNPIRLAAAIEATSNSAAIYISARNRAELKASGASLSGLYTPEQYAKILLGEMSAITFRDAGFKPENPTQAANSWYRLLVDIFGEPHVLSAASTVLDVERDSNGNFETPIVLSGPGGNNKIISDSIEAFNELLRLTPKGYLITLGSSLAQTWGQRLADGNQYYEGLASKHGERRVIQVSEAVYGAPQISYGSDTRSKIADYSGAEQKSPRWWVDNLLANPEITLPTDNKMQAIDATDSQTIMEVVSNPQMRSARVSVYGRVAARKQISIGVQEGEEYYFDGSTHLRGLITGGLSISRTVKRLGGSPIPGKLMKIEGYIAKGQYGEKVRGESFGAYIKFIEDHASIVPLEQWPSEIPLPPVTGEVVFGKTDQSSGGGLASKEAQQGVTPSQSAVEVGSEVENIRLKVAPEPLATAQPVYPRRALTRGIEGWAEVEYTISEAGQVEDVAVVDANPVGIFDRAAIKAISKWQYQPQKVNDKSVRVIQLRHRFQFQVE
jgi:TonB family protein